VIILLDLFIVQIVTGIILYTVYKYISGIKFDIAYAALTVVTITISSIILMIAIPHFAISAIVTNSIMAIIMAFIMQKKVNLFLLSVFYGVLSVIISLMAAQLSNALLGLLHLVITSYIPLGRYAITNNWVMIVIYLVLLFVVSCIIAINIGIYLQKRIVTYDEIIKSKLAAYLMYGAVITLIVFFIHIFLRYIIDEIAISAISYAVATAVSFAYLVFAIFAFSDSMRMKMELQHKDELAQNLQTYAKHMDNATESIRLFRHDHMNLMMLFDQYIKDRDWEGMQERYNSYMDIFKAATSSEDAVVKKLDNIKIPEVNSLLVTKCIQGQQNGISVWVEVPDIVTLSDNSDYILLDIMRIIGVLIDNALEACKGVDGAEVRVIALNKDDSILLIFENTCHHPPPINNIFTKGFSSKGSGRGLGLYNVSQIISKNNRLTLGTDIAKGKFTQTLIIAN